MASVPQGDIVGNKHPLPAVGGYTTSVATNGANALLGTPIGPFPWPIKIKNVWWTPTGASHTATQSGSYRQLALINQGPAGTGTAALATYNASSTVSSLSPTPWVVSTVNSVVTVAAGNVIQFSQATVGGTDSNGTGLPTGQFSLAYEII